MLVIIPRRVKHTFCLLSVSECKRKPASPLATHPGKAFCAEPAIKTDNSSSRSHWSSQKGNGQLSYSGPLGISCQLGKSSENFLKWSLGKSFGYCFRLYLFFILRVNVLVSRELALQSTISCFNRDHNQICLDFGKLHSLNPKCFLYR